VKTATAALQAKLDRVLKANSELTAQFVSQAKQLDQARRKARGKGVKRAANDDGTAKVHVAAPRAKTAAKQAASVPATGTQCVAAEGVRAGPMDRFVRVGVVGDAQDGCDGPEVVDMASDDGLVVPPRRAKKSKRAKDPAIGARTGVAATEEVDEGNGGAQDSAGALATVSKAKVSGVGCF
jgi:hypothetical protein